MRAVDLYAGKPCHFADRGAVAKAANHVFDFCHRHFTRRGEQDLHVFAKGNGRGGYCFLVQPFGGLLARVVELHPYCRFLCCCSTRPATQAGEIGFILNNDIAWLSERAAVDHDVAGDDQTKPRFGPAPIQRREPGRWTIGPRAKRLAHCCFGETISQDGAVGQSQRCGQ